LKFSIGTTVSYSTINLNSSDGSLTYSVDGNYLVGYREGTISFYDSFSGAIIKTLNGDYIFVNHLAISPDGALLLASNSANYEVRVYDIAANSMVRILDASTGVSGLHFSSDGKSFIVAYKDGNISKYSVSELSYSWQRIK
jgi:WD40 repeat protein